MNPTRRHVMAFAGAAGAALAAPAIAQSAWPTKPVRFVVPFPPGQAADIFARLMAEKLSEKWKQQVIVENKAGGSGIPATEYGKMAAPDGYTLMVVSSGTFGVNPSLYPDLPYKPLTDFLPISNIFLVPLVIVAHPSLPVNTLAELIALAKKEPGQLSYASAGPGTSQHLAMELFKLKAGVDIVHIPYKGSGPAMADLLGGHVKLMMDSTASALNAIKDGRIKAIAVTTSRPAPPPLDKIPLIAATIPGFNAAGWSGLAAPARTPLEIVAKVSRDMQTLLNDEAVIKQIEQRAALPAPGTPIQFAEFIKNEIDTWGEVVKATGTKPGN
ncbi:Bug family tripartite tricarboxylate transporter substrate binding protein [Reyranella sp.]|jgi:tripartite-type tricarboxylate transporter receptor subunit TctC|uniref:Bug family tripartite tricarboxylate transporter substrate binding protein n=1 Tax=Reyranella sp. TaxID=1929291 RepID=UPI003BAC2023